MLQQVADEPVVVMNSLPVNIW